MTRTRADSSISGPQPGPAPAPEARFEQELQVAALDFETGVLETLVERHPGQVAYLTALGQAYSRQRRPERCLEVDLRLVASHPSEPTFRYNLACSLCLTGDLNGACRELLAAVDRGYRDIEHMQQDPDLERLRRDRRFGLVADRLAAARG